MESGTPGNSYAGRTVRELVSERPARARVFRRHGIDCCHGEAVETATLAAACGACGAELAAVAVDLAALDAAPRRDDRDWARASLCDLCDHIEREHHVFLKHELPRLEPIVLKVARNHGKENPKLGRLGEVFVKFKAGIEAHMAREERELFPLCRRLDAATGPVRFECGSVMSPIGAMIDEHDTSGSELLEMRSLTDNYRAPEGCCENFRNLMESLRRLDENMHEHVYMENSVLFLHAAQREAELRRAAGGRRP